MKNKKKKRLFNMDERNMLIAYKVIAVMYIMTIVSLQGIILYRQFILGQELAIFEDFSIVVTVNSLFLISALLYFGAIPLRKIRIKVIILSYLAFVVLGSLFVYLKYNVFQKPGLTIDKLLDKILIVVAITGIIILFYTLFSILGKRKMDKEIE